MQLETPNPLLKTGSYKMGASMNARFFATSWLCFEEKGILKVWLFFKTLQTYPVSKRRIALWGYFRFMMFFGLVRLFLWTTIGVKIITGSLVTLENLFPLNYRYRYGLEIRMNSFNYHYHYRLGVRSHPFIYFHWSPITILKGIGTSFSELPLPLPSWNVFELDR